MPAGEGTGPMGMGAMTGRAAGFCAGFGMPGYANPVAGRGMGYGLGGGRGRAWGCGGPSAGLRAGGRGWRNAFNPFGWSGGTAMPFAAPSQKQQRDALKSQADYFENALKDLRDRIKEIESAK